jgi:hypothetical protein
MKVLNLSSLINIAFNYVVHNTKKLNIDESHAVKHAMEVFHFANNIFNSEVIKNPYLEKQKDVIVVSALIHDMCDRKYIDVNAGLENINLFFKNYINNEKLNTITDIISTISYSKVIKNGFPDLGEYQLAYHIIREADLLSSYDIDRCIIFGMINENLDYHNAVKHAIKIFENRVYKYRDDKLFITNYSKNKSLHLHKKMLIDIENLKINNNL